MPNMKKLLLLTVLVLAFAVNGFAELNSADAYEFLLAKMAAQNNDFGQALKRFDGLIARNPGDPVLLFERAQTLLESGRFDRGVTELRKMVEEHPGLLAARTALGATRIVDMQVGEQLPRIC